MSTRRELLALAGLFAAGMAGCVGSPADGTERPNPGPAPDTPEEVPPALVRGVRSFGCDLLGELDDANLCVSPYSVSVALAMTYAGARGETREAMAHALRYRLEGEDLHGGFAALDAELDERDEVDADDEPFALSVANAVWGQAGYPFRDDFRETLDAYYGVGFREADFEGDAEGERRRINDWVAGETGGRIEELLPEGSLDQLTRAVLTNAVYFEANWASTFSKDATTSKPFADAGGESSQVPMMSQRGTFPHAVVDGHEVVELPYVGGEVGMVVVLPGGDLAGLETDLDGALLAEFDEALADREGTVELPRFEFETDLALEDPLTALGMGVAFDPDEADLGDMVHLDEISGNLHVWDVYHDTYVAIDEEGTEAAAATGVVAGESSAPADAFEFVADRPFLYVVRDRPTGTPLFLGRVSDAAAAQE